MTDLGRCLRPKVEEAALEAERVIEASEVAAIAEVAGPASQQAAQAVRSAQIIACKSKSRKILGQGRLSDIYIYLI